jgi:hypothetical protein
MGANQAREFLRFCVWLIRNLAPELTEAGEMRL